MPDTSIRPSKLKPAATLLVPTKPHTARFFVTQISFMSRSTLQQLLQGLQVIVGSWGDFGRRRR
jgi:hypothetical protein